MEKVSDIATKIEGLILDNFLREYSASQMSRYIRTLTVWRKTHGSAFETEWIKLLERGDSEAQKVDKARRVVSHYFLRALMLYDKGYVTKTFIEAVCSLSGIQILYDIIEPLEQASDSSYQKAAFDRLKDLSPRAHNVSPKVIPVPEYQKKERL